METEIENRRSQFTTKVYFRYFASLNKGREAANIHLQYRM